MFVYLAWADNSNNAISSLQTNNDSKQQEECNKAANKIIGKGAQVLACGQLTHSKGLEAFAVIRLKGFKENKSGIPVSKFVILRRDKADWIIELIADKKPLRNKVGYVGVYNIDPSEKDRYRISFSGGGPKSKDDFSLDVYYIDPDGQTEGWPLEIEWNPKVKRFQEYIPNEGFKPEIKNPKQITYKCCAH